MKIPKKAQQAAKGLFRSCLADGRPDEHRVRQAVESLIAGRPRGYLAILRHFQRLVKLDTQRRTARIESAAPLPFKLQASVQAALRRIYGPSLEISFTRKAALLGGMRIQVGGDVYDANVQARLAALERSFESRSTT